jgi:PAS domain S-box-containing protein
MTSSAALPRRSDDEVRVLYVGGEADAADNATAALERENGQFVVETTTCADTALERLTSADYDCVLSEYEIPGRNGIEFLETVRTAYPSLPFILFTGAGSETIASDAITAGATDYVQKKPGTEQYELLANRIQNAVRQYQSEHVEQRLLELTENTDRAFFVYSGDWSELLFVNRAYEDIWGQSISELREDPVAFLDGIHPADRDRIRDAMDKVSNGDPVNVEYRVSADEQNQRWVRSRCEPIVDESGTVQRVAGFGTDITEEHCRRERRERQRETLVALATSDPVTTGDFERAVEQITETAADVLDVDRVNVWLTDEDSDDDILTCVDNYDRRTGEHTSGTTLLADEHQRYCQALETNRAIDAADAREDPRTAELSGYLDEHDIGALLDGTLRLEGDVVGTICHEHTGEPREWTDDEIEFASDVADIVHRALRNDNRNQRERQLRKERERFEKVLDTSPVAIILLDADGSIEQANDHAADIFELERSEISSRTYDDPAWGIVDEDGEPIPGEQLPVRQVLETGEPVYDVEHGIRTGEGNERWLSINAAPLPGAEGENERVLSVVKDITEQHHLEQTLETLHERAQAMARTEDREAIAGVASETMDELLGVDGTAMYEFDGTDKLRPLEWSGGAETVLDDPPVPAQENGLAWEGFVGGDERFFPDLREVDEPAHDIPLRSAFILPVDNHGILLTGTTDSWSLSATERKAARLIGENLAAALDRAEREQRLRERDRTLQRQNNWLEQLNRLNTIIRETTAAVIQSNSREDIEHHVCEQIAAGPEYSFAWFGGHDQETGTLDLSDWEGMEPEYVEFLESRTEQTPLHQMAATAVRDGSVQVAQNVLERSDWKSHRKDVLSQGYRSVAVVPIVVRDHVDSVLVIHGATAGLFDDREREVLRELGEAVGFAIQNLDSGTTLQRQDRTEVELVIGDDRLFSNQIAGALGTELTLVGAIPGESDSIRAFLRLASNESNAVAASLDELNTVVDTQSLSDDGETALYQVTLETPQLIRQLQANDVHLDSLRADTEQTTITATLTSDVPVRPLVEELQTAYPETALQARRKRPQSIDTQETFYDHILEQLTDKQFDALQTALYGGFYEWPRTSTREELAATRDIASSTFSHHLRAAERKVIAAILDSA